MGFFKKKGVEVIDFTDMQRRGLLKKEKSFNSNEDGGDFIDFSVSSSKSHGSLTENHDSNSSSNSNSISSDLSSDGFVDFFGNSTPTKSSSVADSLREARRNLGSSEVNELRLKLDDAEFKIGMLSDKILELERRISERGI